MVTSQKIKKELQRKDEEEASAQPRSIPHKDSSNLREVGKLDHSALKFSIETLEELETTHRTVPHPSPLVRTGMPA